MTVYNFGSINLDHIYRLDHFVRPGETRESTNYQRQIGGKGANQSVALARAGAHVKHVGVINHNDHKILDKLSLWGVDTGLISQLDVPTGHAIIQLNRNAENAIILFRGANHSLTKEQVNTALSEAKLGDWVLIQNETNLVKYIASKAQRMGLKVAFNPAPMDVDLTKSIMSLVNLLVVNEVEATDLIGSNSTIEVFEKVLPEVYPNLSVLMTLGKSGVRYFEKQSQGSKKDSVSIPAFSVKALDTTAAGDAFIGFFLSSVVDGENVLQAMTRACAASAICVTKMGAAVAIPMSEEVNQFLAKHI